MKKNNLMKTLTNRTFCQNKGRNLVASISITLLKSQKSVERECTLSDCKDIKYLKFSTPN